MHYLIFPENCSHDLTGDVAMTTVEAYIVFVPGKNSSVSEVKLAERYIPLNALNYYFFIEYIRTSHISEIL